MNFLKQKGQMAWIGLLLGVVTLLMLALLAPLFNSQIGSIMNTLSGDVVSTTLIGLVFFIIVMSVVFGIARYIRQSQQ